MARPPRLTEDQRRLWKAYRDLNRELFGRLESQLVTDAALSVAEYSVLVPLSQAADGVLRARELGSELGWDRSRLSHLVTRMEKRGLVVREECSEDARGSMVRLTPAGRAAVDDAAPEHAEAVRRYFFDPLSPGELQSMAGLLNRLLANLERGEP